MSTLLETIPRTTYLVGVHRDVVASSFYAQNFYTHLAD